MKTKVILFRTLNLSKIMSPQAKTVNEASTSESVTDITLICTYIQNYVSFVVIIIIIYYCNQNKSCGIFDKKIVAKLVKECKC